VSNQPSRTNCIGEEERLQGKLRVMLEVFLVFFWCLSNNDVTFQNQHHVCD
jgi:hypothetical protein